MSEGEVTRRLTTIVAADVAGYSRLVSEDEDETFAALRAHRRELIDPKIAEYRGRVANTAGDSILIEFPSVIEALRCMIDIRQGIVERNAEVPEERQILFRVGINLGDVIEQEDGDLLGDGVNVAARLEGLAEPGGICLSRGVRDNVRDRLDVALEDMGEVQVKNIARPVRVFRVLADGDTRGAPMLQRRSKRLLFGGFAVLVIAILVGGGLWWWQPWLKRVAPADPARMALTLPDKPSLAVLPFDNLTGEPDRQFLIDGFAEQLITTLSRHPDIMVIARNSSFSFRGKSIEVRRVAEELGVRYVIEGSLQQAGERIRINVQLIDAIKGFHVWSKAYDRPAADFFAVQDDVIGAIAAELLGRRGEILVAEHERIATKQTGDLTVYEIQEMTNVAYGKRTKEGNAEARRLTERLLELDPDSARAHAFMAWVELMEYWQGWTTDREATLSRACAEAERAVELDRREYQGHWAAAWCYVHTGRPEDMRRAFETAVRLNPAENGLTLNYATQVLLPEGRLDEAIAAVRNIERVNPKGRVIDQVYNALSTLYFEQGEYRTSLDYLSRMSEAFAKGRAFRIRRVAALHYLGQTEQARHELDAFLADQPGFAVATVAKAGGVPPKSTAAIQEALRTLGVPEEPPPKLPKKPSIAVLPFANLSDDKEQEYFADGMADDLITDLSHVSGLVVISRTSSFAYKGKEAKMQQIARELEVRYLLEGSVRRAGDQVRINAQLIDGESGAHLWAETFDRPYRDILHLQDEVTGKIAQALKIKLTPEEEVRLARKPTENLEAYDHFLKAEELRQRSHWNTLRPAFDHYDKALALDPNFIEAHVGLARALDQVWQRTWIVVVDPAEAKRRLLAEIDAILDLDPSNVDALDLKVNVYIRSLQNERALDFAEKAVRLHPDNTTMLLARAFALVTLGRVEMARVDVERAEALFERPTPDTLIRVAWLRLFLGDYAEAVAWGRKLRGGKAPVLSDSFELLVANTGLGKMDEAEAELQNTKMLWPWISIAWERTAQEHFRDADMRERYFSLLAKARVPEWPFGFQGDPAQRLKNTDLDELFRGRPSLRRTKSPHGRDLIYHHDGLGNWTVEVTFSPENGVRVSGTMTIKDDRLCTRSESEQMGRERCAEVYRNPAGVAENWDEFILIDMWGKYTFSMEYPNGKQ